MGLTREEARAMLKVWPPVVVAFTADNGRIFDADGNELDARQTVPHVLALGPFGSWFSTLEDAEDDFAREPAWFAGKSFRVGYAVVYEQGWGYAANKPARGGE